MGKKKTHEEFVKEVIEIRGDIYDFIGCYESSTDKIKIKHRECRHEWNADPRKLNSKKQKGKIYCPKCNGGVKISHDEFIQKVYDLVGDEYEILGQYKNALIKISVKHNECGNIYEVQPSNFLHGNRCPKCSFKLMGNKKRKTHEQFIKEVFELVGDEYTILETYKDSNTKIKVIHNICGRVYYTTPANLLSGKGCFPCGVKKRANTQRKSQEEFENEVFNLGNGEYTILGKYIKNNKKIKIRHDTCGYEYEVQPWHFIEGNRCPICASNFKKTTEDFKQEVYDLEGNEYTVLEEYINAHTKLKIKHEKCEHIYEIAPNTFLRGVRCSTCKSSKGEVLIAKFLDKNNITYEPQYRFDDCRFKKTLPFDFALFNDKNNLMFLVEYDGEQHFEPKEHFGGIKEFELRKLRDQIKNTYCKENNIHLYRIPYWKFNDIEEILNKLIHNELVEVDETSFLVV